MEENFKSAYTPEFVEKLKQGEADIADRKTIRLNPDNVWENIR